MTRSLRDAVTSDSSRKEVCLTELLYLRTRWTDMLPLKRVSMLLDLAEPKCRSRTAFQPVTSKGSVLPTLNGRPMFSKQPQCLQAARTELSTSHIAAGAKSDWSVT